jgi:pyridinium-3,5-biscarboxylic acid mononucleotide synthase
MENDVLHSILKSVSEQSLSVGDAMKKLAGLPFDDIGFARVDHHRALRKGYPEVIFCQNKTPSQVVEITKNLMAHEETVFGTRASKDTLDMLESEIPGVEIMRPGRCFWKKSKHWKKKENVKGTILVASAGTADQPVVEEAQRTVEILGHPCMVLNDVGVAGIHRLFSHKKEILDASVIIVIAGMEGALPSVVAGLVACPVIAVPTSIGYGSHMGGLVPLFAMLNSCASGMTVVNIDNGFGAGYAAVLMNGR